MIGDLERKADDGAVPQQVLERCRDPGDAEASDRAVTLPRQRLFQRL
jgi:hypothetical protein